MLNRTQPPYLRNGLYVAVAGIALLGFGAKVAHAQDGQELVEEVVVVGS